MGILTKTEALEKAKELGLDLIEIAPNADPPVAKITDFLISALFNQVINRIQNLGKEWILFFKQMGNMLLNSAGN